MWARRARGRGHRAVPGRWGGARKADDLFAGRRLAQDYCKAFLSKVVAAEVAAAALTDRANEVSGVTVRVWLGLCEGEAEATLQVSDSAPSSALAPLLRARLWYLLSRPCQSFGTTRSREQLFPRRCTPPPRAQQQGWWSGFRLWSVLCKSGDCCVSNQARGSCDSRRSSKEQGLVGSLPAERRAQGRGGRTRRLARRSFSRPGPACRPMRSQR